MGMEQVQDTTAGGEATRAQQPGTPCVLPKGQANCLLPGEAQVLLHRCAEGAGVTSWRRRARTAHNGPRHQVKTPPGQCLIPRASCLVLLLLSCCYRWPYSPSGTCP